VTPIRGAEKAVKYFNRSALLTINTPGHCSCAATSLCAARYFRNYVRPGELPAEGTVCEVEDVRFGSKPEAVVTSNSEDKVLIEVARGLAENFHAARRGYGL